MSDEQLQHLDAWFDKHADLLADPDLWKRAYQPAPGAQDFSMTALEGMTAETLKNFLAGLEARMGDLAANEKDAGQRIKEAAEALVEKRLREATRQRGTRKAKGDTAALTKTIAGMRQTDSSTQQIIRGEDGRIKYVVEPLGDGRIAVREPIKGPDGRMGAMKETIFESTTVARAKGFRVDTT